MERPAVVDAHFGPRELQSPAPVEAVESFRRKVLDALARHQVCVLRGVGFLHLSSQAEAMSYVARVSRLFGTLSDNNRFNERSGTFVDAVHPSDPRGQDLTFQLGACEAHSDESSKLTPEDLVFLWCVRPARSGGASRVWRARDLERSIRDRHGPLPAEVLRRPRFLFGGKLRQPRRVLRAPVLFGVDGIRFRLGTIRDGFESAGTSPDPDQMAALRALSAAIEREPPLEHTLGPGEALVLLNRRTLHARTDFLDRNRLLYRTRCFNTELSNTAHDEASWLT